ELNGDVDAYSNLVTPDFTGSGPAGFVLTAEQWAQRHRGDVENHEFEVTDPHVRVYGDTAIVEGVQTQRTTARGRDTSGSFRLGLVAVRTSDSWAIAHLQLSGPLIAAGEMPAFAR
ncbi:MAG: nuclear transport factor 2 family protein, partial [Actinomycetota bacterium]|nr:nuclear transport factor 2 family protein [Actinomycetota bacterium]